MQPTSLLFPRKFSHPLATKALMIALSIGAHYLVASNLGIFGSFTPPKLKSGGGTVKIVSLTPAEQTRVPEAVKSNPLPIAKNPVNPTPATRNFSGFSTPPTIPSANRTTNSTSPTPQTKSDSTTAPSNNPNSPSVSPSSRPASEKSTPRRSTTDPFDRNNRFSSMPRGSQGDQNGTPTTKPASDPNNSSPRGTRSNSSNNNPPSTPPSSPPTGNTPPNSPTGEPVNRNKPFQEKLKIVTNLIREQFPGQEIVTENIPVNITDGSNIVSGLSGPKQYFEMSYFYGKGDIENPIFIVPIDPSINTLLGPNRIEKLLNAAQAKAMGAYEQRLKRSPESAKNKIFRYDIRIAINSR